MAERDCSHLEQANLERIQQLGELDDVLQDQQNFIQGLEPNDPQRSDIQTRIDTLMQQKSELVEAVKKGEDELKACQQAD